MVVACRRVWQALVVVGLVTGFAWVAESVAQADNERSVHLTLTYHAGEAETGLLPTGTELIVFHEEGRIAQTLYEWGGRDVLQDTLRVRADQAPEQTIDSLTVGGRTANVRIRGDSSRVVYVLARTPGLERRYYESRVRAGPGLDLIATGAIDMAEVRDTAWAQSTFANILQPQESTEEEDTTEDNAAWLWVLAGAGLMLVGGGLVIYWAVKVVYWGGAKLSKKEKSPEDLSGELTEANQASSKEAISSEQSHDDSGQRSDAAGESSSIDDLAEYEEILRQLKEERRREVSRADSNSAPETDPESDEDAESTTATTESNNAPAQEQSPPEPHIFLGEAFCAWCQQGRVMVGRYYMFERAVQETFPDATVSPIYHTPEADIPFQFEDRRAVATFWLVEIQGASFLLPVPRRDGSFEALEPAVPAHDDANPAELVHATPARLTTDGAGYRLVEAGQFAFETSASPSN